MIPKECKRLAEVDFPIAEVSRHAAREKSIRHGHPSTLHLWWARRPLASSRAVLMALLLPDPGDSHCPEEFKTRAKELLLAMRERPRGWNTDVQTDEGLRKVLLKFIADFSNWDNAARDEYLETGRGLVQAAHPEQTPLVWTPSPAAVPSPLEALRVGCDAFASDLNPVACLILKVMLEDIPGTAPGWPTNSGRRERRSRPRPRRNWPTSTPRTRMEQHPSPTSGQDGPVRVPELRGRDPTDAVYVAVPEAQPEVGTPPQRGSGQRCPSQG